jgi:phosphoserine aminotransferase
MSSDIFSKDFDANEFALIYAGAQKNMGPAGTILYIIDKDVLGKSGRKLPAYLDLQAHIDKDSMYNTPPVFAIYASMLTLRWIKSNGGLKAWKNATVKRRICFTMSLTATVCFMVTAWLIHDLG